MKLDRLERLLLLVPLARLHGEKGIPISEALSALRLERAQELIEDVEELTLVGDPAATPDGFVDICIEDDHVRVFLPQGFAYPPRFTAVEGAAMLAALRPLEKAGILEVESARAKLQKALPAAEDGSIEALLLSRAARIEAAEPPPFRALLEAAAEEKRELEITYFALADGAEKTHCVEPRAVLLHGGRWYLAAWNPEKGEEHLYRLDRMSGLRATGRNFAAHKGPPLDRYALDHLYVPSGAEEDVEVRFSKEVADSVLRDWAGIAERQADGTVIVRTRLAGDHYALAWVLGYGGEAEVLRPLRLREQLGERLARLRALYGSPPAGA